jgi:hypothetical protein
MQWTSASFILVLAFERHMLAEPWLGALGARVNESAYLSTIGRAKVEKRHFRANLES